MLDDDGAVLTVEQARELVFETQAASRLAHRDLVEAQAALYAAEWAMRDARRGEIRAGIKLAEARRAAR